MDQWWGREEKAGGRERCRHFDQTEENALKQQSRGLVLAGATTGCRADGAWQLPEWQATRFKIKEVDDYVLPTGALRCALDDSI